MFCSWRARQAGDQLIGTAATASLWLLIEHSDPWGAHALPDSTLPDRVKSTVAEWTKTVDGLRVQLICRDVGTQEEDGQTAVFLCAPDPQSPRLLRTHVADDADIADLDVPGVAGSVQNDDAINGGFSEVDDTLVLTCTNGKRDKCCARYGNALHDAFRETGAEAWQSSHLGGHRFAPTCVLLPRGAHYGWLAADDAGALWQSHHEGDLYRLDRYRGHVGYDRPAQAGAIFLRQVLETTSLDALTYDSTRQSGDTWRVRFAVDGDLHEIKLDTVPGETVPLSCGGEAESTTHYRLQGHRTV